MSPTRHIAACWVASHVALLTACAGVPFDVDNARQQSTAHHTALALKLERQGDLNAAYRHWQIVETLLPDDNKASDELKRLRSSIANRARDRFSKARKLDQVGNSRQARIEALKALALEPQNQEYFAFLRKLSEKQARRKLRARLSKRQMEMAKQEREPGSESVTTPDSEQDYLMQLALRPAQADLTERDINKPQAALKDDPGGAEALTRRTDRHLELAKQSNEQGNLESAMDHLSKAIRYAGMGEPHDSTKMTQLRRDVAESSYKQGVRIFPTDIDQAIRYWERSVEFHPGHEKAKLRLYNATQMKRTLQAVGEETK